MSNHLSQDQIARWILGQSTLEEEEHGHACPACSAELKQFRKTVSTFQRVMKNWSEREIVPRLEETSEASSSRRGLYRPSLTWALVGVAIALLAVIPIYKLPQPESARESVPNPQVKARANEDVLLMEQVTTRLSRSLPKPMQRVIVLLPTEEASMME